MEMDALWNAVLTAIVGLIILCIKPKSNELQALRVWEGSY